ncbi:MAG TPA: hypothetical protein VFW33_10670 [Gemmataceae bacterium]|nr:hypothetical protein [Gemmataceae bacterium]
MCDLIKEARRQQTLRELTRLGAELKEWHERRRGVDRADNGVYRGQYESQLAAVVGEVGGAACRLCAEVERLPAAQSPGDFYAACARHDRQVIWLWRAWDFFRARFDQRDDPALRDALRAADEVVWSCYKPFFHKTERTLPPAPLPYVEPRYSPMAFGYENTELLADDGGARDNGPLADYFRRLPIPVLRLPTTVVTSPWALVLVGHEVGHFVQALVEPEAAYPGHFRRALERAVARAGGDDDEQQSWGAWSPEVFADWYCVLTMGPWALWALGQFERGGDAEMVTPRGAYPSPLARLVLIAALAKRVGLSGTGRLLRQLLDARRLATESAESRRDVRLAARVAAWVAAEPLPGDLGAPGTLPQLLTFRAADYWPPFPDGVAARDGRADGPVAEWAAVLRGDEERPPKQELRAARLVAAAAARAWREIVQLTGAEREKAVRAYDERAYATMIACYEPTRRGEEQVAPARDEEPGARLAGLLLRAGEEALFR